MKCTRAVSRFALLLAIALAPLVAYLHAQSAMPTANILFRMSMLQSEYGRGTTFSIDVDNREYWITAKHLLTGAKHPPYGSVSSNSALLQILDPTAQQEKWLSVNFSVIDAGTDVDIVALAPPHPLINNPLQSEPADSAGITLGGDCEFLGFPFGGSWRASFDNGISYWMPFVKHCTVSALPSEGARVWVLDGINNEGFSGGPVVFSTGSQQKIMAVVSAYVTEPADVISSLSKTSSMVHRQPDKMAKPKKQIVELNSGFILAYDIQYALQAIQKSPIGPLRPIPQKK